MSLRLLIASLSVYAAVDAVNVLHERRSTPRLQESRPIDADAILPLRIGLAQQNLDRGYDYLLDVSFPESENYGKHWSNDDLAVFAPSQEAVDAVVAWLDQAGFATARQSSNKGWISFNASAAQAGQLFQTTFQEYEARDGTVRVGCDEYFLPEHLARHVDYLVPGIRLSPPMRKSVTKRDKRWSPRPHGSWWEPPQSPPRSHWGWTPPPGSGQLPPELVNCGANITPPCYRYLYDIPQPSDIHVPSGILGVFETGLAYAQRDLDMYFAEFAPNVPQGTHPHLYSINNATAPTTQASGESDIDFEVVYSVLGPADVSLYQSQVPAGVTNTGTMILEPFLDAIDGSYCDEEDKAAGYQCGAYPLTSIVSFSYELPELFEQSAAYQIRACNEFMKLGLKGHTFIFSSGDYGVATNPAFGFGLPCIVNGCVPQDLDMDVTYPFNGTIFVPNFPSSCPYILSVGATQLQDNQTVLDPESVMEFTNDLGLACKSNNVTFSSGGGFANYFSRPSYQDAAVTEYLDNHVPDYPYYECNGIDVTDNNTNIGKNGGIYNRNGRAIPDVSANGAHYLYYNQGNLSQTYGTSLATPLVASMFAIINAERAAAGKSPVGFVNPILYQNPGIFNDVKNGTNAGCYTDGFPAVEGWDPSSGLGTPNFRKLQEVFMGLP